MLAFSVVDSSNKHVVGKTSVQRTEICVGSTTIPVLVKQYICTGISLTKPQNDLVNSCTTYASLTTRYVDNLLIRTTLKANVNATETLVMPTSSGQGYAVRMVAKQTNSCFMLTLYTQATGCLKAVSMCHKAQIDGKQTM